jgi:hypothetical protein
MEKVGHERYGFQTIFVFTDSIFMAINLTQIQMNKLHHLFEIAKMNYA